MVLKVACLLPLLMGCTPPEDQARTWLSDHDYTPRGVSMMVESTIGPHRCSRGFLPVRAVGRRFPVPEENPCLYIETSFVLCCPEFPSGCRVYSAADKCGREEGR